MTLPVDPPIGSPTITCNPNSLAAAAACFGPSCTGPDMREAIDVYVRVQELAAVGGTDYRTNLAKLAVDTKGWLRLDEDTRRQITLLLDVDNALKKGAVFASDINSLQTASRCYLCLPWEQRKAIKLFLKCQLNTLGQPE